MKRDDAPATAISAGGPDVAKEPLVAPPAPALPEKTVKRDDAPVTEISASGPTAAKELSVAPPAPVLPEKTVKRDDAPAMAGGQTATASSGLRPAEMKVERDAPSAAAARASVAEARDQYTATIAAGHNEAVSYAQRARASLSGRLCGGPERRVARCFRSAFHGGRACSAWSGAGPNSRPRRGQGGVSVGSRTPSKRERNRGRLRPSCRRGLRGPGADAGDAKTYEPAVADLSCGIQELKDQPCLSRRPRLGSIAGSDGTNLKGPICRRRSPWTPSTVSITSLWETRSHKWDTPRTRRKLMLRH